MLSIKSLWWLVCLSWCDFVIPCERGEYLYKFIRLRRAQKRSYGEASSKVTNGGVEHFSKVYVVEEQPGLMENDKVKSLPGETEGVDFDQYGGYVTVDAKAGRKLFYYFVESPSHLTMLPTSLLFYG
ncbi:hypothetical protein VNO78_28770 [Psophocarpus tetragonolobus]|uniref:Uncharacterized protein n=1 Tax=Psophocarpus tetragonolobus TaxID=3891 RepID=A0AAN9X1A5_PSOTE